MDATGDRPSFEERFAALAAISYRVGYRLVGDRVEAEDLAQEALARAYASWRKIAPYDEAWVARVTTNLAIARWRKHKRLVVGADSATAGGRADHERPGRRWPGDAHVDWAVEHVVVDSQLGVADLVDLVEAIAAVDPAAVSEANLPVVEHPGDPNRLAADPERAPAAVAAFVEGRSLPSEPLAVSPGVGGTFPEGDGAVVEAC